MNDDIICESCMYYTYDDDYDCGVCGLNFDEDEMQRLIGSNYKTCKYFRLGDDYTIVRKQN